MCGAGYPARADSQKMAGGEEISTLVQLPIHSDDAIIFFQWQRAGDHAGGDGKQPDGDESEKRAETIKE